LFPKKIRYENVAFIFSSIKKQAKSIEFNFIEWYPVLPNDYVFRSFWHVELKDDIRPRIIKKAFDMDAAIVEIHSHPYDAPATFSGSDLDGLQEFVPHVRWRLKGKPYAALVFSNSDFDGLAWVDNDGEVQPLTELIVNGCRLKPNGHTLSRRSGKYEFRPL
jgi:hypothetical protein